MHRLILAFVVRIWHKGLTIWLYGGREGLGFYLKKYFGSWYARKKIKWFKRGTKDNIKNSEKKIFWTHMMEMIPFYLIFPNVVGFWGGMLKLDNQSMRICNFPVETPATTIQTPFSMYILSETRNCVYIYFCANTIIYSATRHHSNISLASTNKIWGILKGDI